MYLGARQDIDHGKGGHDTALFNIGWGSQWLRYGLAPGETVKRGKCLLERLLYAMRATYRREPAIKPNLHEAAKGARDKRTEEGVVVIMQVGCCWWRR
jgi:hypothetical protein